MKKKALAIALAVALLAIMVGSSLAYFTDTDQVTNTFTVGSVLIDIYENGNLTVEDTIKFEQQLIPVVNTTEPNQDPSYIKKEVSVNSNGENAAYVRTLLAIPAKLENYLILDVNTTDWIFVTDYTVTAEDGLTYKVYVYDYNKAVDPKAEKNEDRFTTNVLNGVYLASDVDLEADANGSLWFVKKTNGEITHQSGFLAHNKTATGYTTNVVSVLVAAQAIQAQGFGNATDALNTGFPVGTNPWGTATLNP